MHIADAAAAAVRRDGIGTVGLLGTARTMAEPFMRIGFPATPRSQHRGALVPGAPPQLLGQGNHCAMLEQGYLEVLGIFDRSLPTPAQQYLDKYEGPHIIAMRPDTAERAVALAASGAPLDPPRELGREVPFGPQGTEQRRVDFRNFRFRADRFPEATFFFTQHLTRDVMWQPHLLTHPNGARRLARAYLFSTDPAGTAQRMGELLGVEAVADGAGGHRFTFGNSSLRVLSAAGLQRLFPDAVVPATSRPIGYAVAVESLDAVAALLAANAVAFQRGEGGGLVVPPASACGNFFHFIEGS